MLVTLMLTSQSEGHRTAYSTPRRRSHEGAAPIGVSLSPTVSRDEHSEDTAVPLEGRILRDAQGKVIFVGDCAPLSFLQTVRHLIASAVDADALPAQSSRDSIIEAARPGPADQQQSLSVSLHEVRPLVQQYTVAVSGLVDLFEHNELVIEMSSWATGSIAQPNESAAAVFYLVLAIGGQENQCIKAEAWFTHARDILLKNLVNSMNVSTVQGFALVAIYMLRAFQPNGAYLYFSLAARTAYAIGLHRTEVNASFGDSIKVVRDRIWKSVRVVDQLISNLLGRPPSTSDVDCTVKYSVTEVSEDMEAQALDASVQIFMIIERVVVEVYSRKRISLRIANYVSRQLKAWASTWLEALHETTSRANLSSSSPNAVVGACSTLCSYYYGIMLLTRPFLIYELYEYMGASLKGGGTQVEHEEKRKYADAALDAASSFVDTLQTVIHAGKMPRRMPLIVSWLFTTSLVLAVGVLGHSGLTFKDDCHTSIRCLDYFGKVDPHARQYSLTVQSLLQTTTAHIREREQHLRSQQKQASSQLFGLLPPATNTPRSDVVYRRRHSTVQSSASSVLEQDNTVTAAPSDWTIYDADFFSMPWMNENDQGLQGFLQPGTHTFDGGSIADIPLFPMYDQQSGGGFL
ncbi:DNA binding [Ascochyta rabiei]|uniref:DNA binding n=1 Tax=Didymella rabiei TaxID=5454 RepID=A0A163AH41_DIDRA|nr:DNA binding [Ascochyta rabiei]